MRAVALIAVLAAFSLAACGGGSSDTGSATSTGAGTGGTASAKPAAVDAACKKAFPGVVQANANFVPSEVVPQTNKIAAAADQAGEPNFAGLIRDFAKKLAAVGQTAARDTGPLDKATEAATAEASKIGAPTCVHYINAYREAAGTG